MNVIVKRSEWNGLDRCVDVHSNNHTLIDALAPSRLFDGSKMCCLGFACEQLGVPREKINDFTMPQAVTYIFPEYEAMLAPFIEKGHSSHLPANNTLSLVAARINDAFDLTQDEKESQLITLFAEHGHTITFED